MQKNSSLERNNNLIKSKKRVINIIINIIINIMYNG